MTWRAVFWPMLYDGRAQYHLVHDPWPGGQYSDLAWSAIGKWWMVRMTTHCHTTSPFTSIRIISKFATNQLTVIHSPGVTRLFCSCPLSHKHLHFTTFLPPYSTTGLHMCYDQPDLIETGIASIIWKVYLNWLDFAECCRLGNSSTCSAPAASFGNVYHLAKVYKSKNN